ncbi:E3 ubiquitin-protein ligase UPL4 isoform X1 [Telopea speciosissima]|uniref:E3 ubiquitin-protein ligase UPL4 isoform X1 n=1 Tax=Telopea speciosissima TaxID=54955 RepID=UPI001CC4B4C3|nr:E3 ubiquitin-protein ligase UPL4 isoform X1 [Telopea speciosissima]
MENRGRKRAELADQLRADKRACSSSEFRPGSSSSCIQAQMISTNSVSETPECEMETSSSASASGRSEGEADRDSGYGSCDSDGLDDSEHRHKSFREYHPRRSSGDHAKFKRILSSLEDEAEPGSQLAALTELCDVLSFCTEDSLSCFSSDAFAPVLVKLARHDNNPDIMLLSIRAVTYLCDVLPRSSGFLVRHEAVPALCSRLMAIEYLDVAEQCLQALEKISHDHPLACSQAGAIMAVLNYIDFFSTSIQRVALSIVANICKKLPSDCSAPYMEAVPILCNLIQYEDPKLVENVAMCLIRIVERVSHSPEMLNDLCKHGVIHQATNLIALNSRTTLSQPIYSGLIGMLARLASGSVVAVRTLFELNICTTLKHILSSYDIAHGLPYPVTGDAHSNQVRELLKLINELLPSSARSNGDIQLVSDKEKILIDRPELLRQFGIDILPVLIQVVNSGANLYVCYGCLSIINKFVYFSRSDMLLDLVKNTNISSFLAGVFSRKDHHVLISALRIAETVLSKLPDVFLSSFVKEGVVYAIDALLTPERSSQLMVPTSCSILIGSDQRLAAKDALKCLCFAFDADCSSSSEMQDCKIEDDSVKILAMHIKATYFLTESQNSEIGLTETLQKLRTFCAYLTDNVSMSIGNDIYAQQEENLYHILHQIMAELSGREPMSTFEFIESGIVKSLVNYLSNGKYLEGKTDPHGLSTHFHFVLKRLEMFARFCLTSTGGVWEDTHLAVLIRKLQCAFSSIENFPVILSHVSKPRNSYATVPKGRCTIHPCLKVHFVKAEDESGLCNYPGDVLTVEPFSSLDAIEGFLWPKVSSSGGEHINLTSQSLTPSKIGLPLPRHADARSHQDNVQSDMGKTNDLSSDLPAMQVVFMLSEDMAKLSHSSLEGERAGDVIQAIPGDTGPSLNQACPGSTAQDVRYVPVEDSSLRVQDSAIATTSNFASSDEHIEGRKHFTSCSNGGSSPKLIFYLEGRQLDRSLTLYQAILQQQAKAENDVIVGPRFWSEVYKVTYRKAVEVKQSNPHLHGSIISSTLDRLGPFWQDVPFFSSMLISELPCDLEKSNPCYDILFLLKILEGLSRFAFHLMSGERTRAFAEGRINDLDDLKVAVPAIPRTEFVNCKLTEKLEQQMRDQLAVSIGGMPSWCSQLMAICPFLFGFEARVKYFRLTAFGFSQDQSHPWAQSTNNNPNAPNERRLNGLTVPRKKFQVCRSHILDSAAQMMDQYARHKTIIEVEYNEEVGTGLGPTMEFYTLVSQEFQKVGLGMWREDYNSSPPGKSLYAESSGFVMAPFGLFPRPWSDSSGTSDGIQFAEVIKKFVLLGQVVAKALQEGRVLDLPLSKAFCKLIMEQDLNVFDIQSFDPELGRTLLEFQALVDRKKLLESVSVNSTTIISESCFRNTRIEDLFLEFTLPGYPDYILASGPDHKMVNMNNLEEFISLTVDATVNSGIYKQVEAFKSGFNQVFPVKSLQVFTEEELERLLCGEQDAWASNELLDHIKFDHGYTASSPPVMNLLEIIQEFECNQRRAFLQFVTGAPRLPPGGLAALNPKLTIVRKHCGEWADGDLPSVMTCANYLKLPPYSSKERMRERLLYAITEGQGSFHLS